MNRRVSSFLAFAALAAADAKGAGTFELTSPDIAEGKKIDMKHVYDSFGCTGANLSPELHWSEPPAGTKSFAVLAHDPDAPTGGAGFWHWLVHRRLHHQPERARHSLDHRPLRALSRLVSRPRHASGFC